MKAYSERVPGKNMRLLCGRPLFHWIIDSLNESGVVDEIIINTDSLEIANNAKASFDVTIHLRPDYLKNIHSNEAYQIMSYDLKLAEGDYFIQSHSTNPLLKSDTIKAAVKTFFDNLDKYDSLFTVTPLQTRLYDHKYRALNHNPHKLLKTQDLPYIYEENSCIYIFSRKSFEINKNRIGAKPFLFPINRYQAIDIDEEYDFLLAETIMQHQLNSTT